MKRKITMLVAAMAASVSLATSYTWTGSGADATSWNDEDNWDPAGVPGGGDTATFTSAATIADGIVVSSDELKIYANGAVATLNGIISGEGSMYFQCLNKVSSRIVLAGANTYSGTTTIEAGTDAIGNNPSQFPTITGIWVQHASAFGTNPEVSHISGTIVFNCANAVFAKNFTPKTGQVAYAAQKTCTIDGTIASDTFASSMFFVTRTASATLTVNGKVGGSSTKTINLRSCNNGEKIFLKGGIVSTSTIQPGGADGWSYGTTCVDGQITAATLKLGYNVYKLLSHCVLDENILLDFSGYSDGTKALLNLNGTSQTINRLQSDATAKSAATRLVSSTAPATLTIRPTQSSLVNMSKVDGAVTLVMDAKSSDYVQQFSNRVSNTTGSLISSNGILRIGANASFANVPKLVAANNGAIEVTSEVANALAGVREIVIDGNGRVSLPAAALAANAVAVTIAETGSLEITDGTTFEVASLKIGSSYATPGLHPAGSLSPQITGAAVAVPNPVSPDSTGVWTGGGATESTVDPDNWEGGYPGEIPVTFATGGIRAQLAGNLLASSVRFDTPAETPTFTVAVSETTPDAKLYVAEGVAMTNTAHASGHTNVVTAPVVFSGATGRIDVDGPANGLVLGGPLMQQNSSMTLRRGGSGSLFLTATNSSLSGPVYLEGGKTYLSGGALGGTPSAPATVRALIPDSPFDIALYFTGGTYNQNFQLKRAGNYSLTALFLAGTTNVVNGYFEMMNNYSYYPTFMEGSRTVFNGGVRQTWVWGYSLFFKLFGDAEVEIREKPLNVTAESPGDARFYAQSNGSGKNARLVFATTGNYSRDGLYLAGPMHVDIEADFAFNTNSTGVATPIALLKTPISADDDSSKPCVVDLNGHDQRFGSLATAPNGTSEGAWNNTWGSSSTSYFTSETPATMYVLQNGRTNMASRPFPSKFCGALSLVKEGTNTLSLSGNSTMSGRLEVSNGRLEFKNNGAMTNVSEFAVSGGVLAIDKNTRLPRRADCRLSGGKLDLAEGVTINVHMLYVPDGAGGWTEMPVGVYSAANLPAYISGAGSLRVRGDGIGTRLILR